MMSEDTAQKVTISEEEKGFILQGILSEIKKFITAQQFDIWFSALKIYSIQDNNITFITPNDFIREWLRNKYTDLFSNSVYKLLNAYHNIIFITERELKHDHRYSSGIGNPPANIPGSSYGGVFEENPAIPVNKYYSFENFVVGPCNRMAHAAAMAVSESPGHAYNPLFIHGESGLGKTHLLHAINNVFVSKYALKTLYLSCEQFVNHYISTLQTNNWGAFRKLYRNVDALLIDDIHFFSNSHGSREEFFHTFNTLYNARKQIIITSDCPPEAINSLEDRLVSRFKWGLLCGIESPNVETRIAIIKKKANMWGFTLPHECAFHLAEHLSGSIRDLEGAIALLSRETKDTNKPININLIEKIVRDISGNKKSVSIEKILNAVCLRFNISVSQIQSKTRSKSIAFPRQIAMHLSRKLTGMSLTEIGGFIGGRDHSTVIHADEKIAEMSKKDKNLHFILQKLESELQK